MIYGVDFLVLLLSPLGLFVSTVNPLSVLNGLSFVGGVGLFCDILVYLCCGWLQVLLHMSFS